MFLSVFEYLCHIIGERIERNKHGDSGCDVMCTIGIENNLSFTSLFSSVYGHTVAMLF